MRRNRKLRGHKRHWKHIENWIKRCTPSEDPSQLDDRNYIKIWVGPWGNLNLNGRHIAEPKGVSKALIIKGLVKIYDRWKKALDATNEPYYLKIWLYDQRFSKSQVVYARGEYLNFYEKTFYNPEKPKEFKTLSFGYMGKELSEFSADYRWDEDQLLKSDLGKAAHYASLKAYDEAIKWFDQQLTKNPRITPPTEELEEEIFSIKMGDVYLLSRS